MPVGVIPVEQKGDGQKVHLEFEEPTSAPISLESSLLWKTESQTWSVTGRIRNTSTEPLHDVWVLIQLFGKEGEFLTFEEVPLPINPLPPRQASPFKALFEGSLPVESISITFKNSSGRPVPAKDQRRDSSDGTGGLRAAPDEISTTASGGMEERVSGETELNPTRAEMDGRGIVQIPDGERLAGQEETEEALVLSELSETSGEERVESEEGRTVASFSSGTTLDKTDVEMIDVFFPELKGIPEPPGDPENGTPLYTPVLEEASQLLREISDTEVKEQGCVEEGVDVTILSPTASISPTYPWLDAFRHSIETYYETHPDHFVEWIEGQGKGSEGEETFHSLVTILVHARFDQMTKPEKALENTRKVHHLLLQSKIALDEIPSLEGTQHHSADQWRLLFCRALPRIQAIGRDIMNQRRWKACDLEQLIQVIPHMSPEASHKAIQWIQRLHIEGVEIDFSQARILVEAPLYRVVSRLGVLDPQFDYFDGPNSMGDLKVQAFSRMAFPENPLRIEEPIRWIGMGTSEGEGMCVPTYPRCDRCLFTGFCEKHFLHWDPAEKGMRKSG